MKFRFCGDGDCPDWVLAGIHSNLSTLSSIKLRLLAQQVAKSILGEEFNEEKLKDTFGLQKQHNMDVPKAAIACLKYLLVSAVKHEASSATFGEELQQLGLPKEHATAICKVQDEFGAKIKEQLAKKGLTVNELEEVNLNVPENTIDCLQLQFIIKNEIIVGKEQRSTHNLNIGKIDAKVLLNEMKKVKTIMDEMDYEKKYNNDL